MLGLAALAALAAMAFVGVGSASADTLCKVHAETCPEASRFPVPTTIHAFAKEARLLSGEIETVCESLIEGATSKNLGAHKGLEGLINTVTFKNCTGACDFVTGDSAENLPYKVIGLGLNEAGKYVNTEGTLHVFGHKLGAHELAGLLNDCTVFNFDCLYGATSALMTFLPHKPVVGALALKPATIHAKVSLLRVGHSGFCPATAQWHALYDVTKPAGLVALSPKP